ncbi:hypothetical protein R5R35_003234 [Gryllus longicercus]|uniref:Uncharacterized protein n=1 Tax=Gryllus longicercus TaxID=2509291 RepID=A0AAN9VMH6_9ORTH
MRRFLGAWLLLCLLLVTFAWAYPTPDAPAGLAAGRVPLQHLCASFEGLSFPDGARAAPLSQGPCAEGEWAVRDLEAAGGPRLRCARRPCPQGQVPFKSRCLEDGAARAALCPSGGGEVHLSPAGQPLCVAVPAWARGRAVDALCQELRPPATTALAVAARDCAQRDDGGCARAVQEDHTSATVIEPEE